MGNLLYSLEPPSAVRDLTNSTAGIIGYVQIYPEGHGTVGGKKGSVAGCSCVSGEKEMLCSLGAGNEMQCRWTYWFGCCSDDCYRSA